MRGMKTKTTSKKSRAKSMRPRAVAKKRPKPVSIAHESTPLAKKSHAGGDSDRGLYVRFETPEIKGTVKEAADKTGVSMNAYIVAAVLDWVAQGKELPKKTHATQGEELRQAS